MSYTIFKRLTVIGFVSSGTMTAVHLCSPVHAQPLEEGPLPVEQAGSTAGSSEMGEAAINDPAAAAEAAEDKDIKEAIVNNTKIYEEQLRVNKTIEEKPMSKAEIDAALKSDMQDIAANKEDLSKLGKNDPAYESFKKLIESQEAKVEILKQKEPATAEALAARDAAAANKGTKQ